MFFLIYVGVAYLSFKSYGKRYWKGNQLNILHIVILRVAEKLREKNVTFDIETLFERCRKELPHPEPEIGQAIRELYQMKYLVEGKRLFKDEILQNEKRQKIFEYVLKNPGTHEREIRNIFNLGAYEARIHIRFLIKFGFIRNKTFKNRNIYFPITFNESQEIKTLLLRNEKNRKIFEFIKMHQQVRLSEISNHLQVSHSTIQPHIKDLLENDLLRKIQQDGIFYYTLTKSPT